MPSGKGPWRRITDPPSEPMMAWVTVEWEHPKGSRVVYRGCWTTDGLLVPQFGPEGRQVAWMERSDNPKPMQGEFDE